MSQTANTQTINLHDYMWQNRLVLLFAPSAQHEDLKRQLEELADLQAGMEDRDLKVIQLFARSGLLEETELAEEDVLLLRQQFGVPSQGFSFILIGKDGSVKRRSTEVVPAADLFAQIDSMPMRQREMRERN